ncbi:TorF family putative porin [Kordiimonas pumila]|uniref:TorF family putative porin n=1 Tax=Kordiimonas pumila TaxID=2161677 RepID=A0ABV7D8H0_9PROT|nr:TorF family putative porin [Kordiimonas pumila]
MPITKRMTPRAVLLACSASIALMAAPQVAAQDEPAVSLSANAALVSDYRFRGISLSDKDIALQGGFDVATSSGFYVGTWGSSIEQYAGSELELDIYAGYATTLGELDIDVGILAYTYPGSSDTTYWEPYASIGGTVGTIGWTLGAAYALDQSSIGDQDNIYVYLDTSIPLEDTPVSFATRIAYEDGAFGDDKFDWSIGVNYDFESYSIGVAYIDTNVDTNEGKAGVVFSLSSSF